MTIICPGLLLFGMQLSMCSLFYEVAVFYNNLLKTCSIYYVHLYPVRNVQRVLKKLI